MAYAQYITSEELEQLEFVTFSGVIEVIEKEGPQFDAAIEYLSAQPAIGFDTETKPCLTWIHVQATFLFPAGTPATQRKASASFLKNTRQLTTRLCGTTLNTSSRVLSPLAKSAA